jgi:YggT family protein
MAIVLLLIRLYELIVLGRVVLSWIHLPEDNIFVRGVYIVTEPVLAPIRKILPFAQTGFDFSPIIVFILIDIIRQAIFGHL